MESEKGGTSGDMPAPQLHLDPIQLAKIAVILDPEACFDCEKLFDGTGRPRWKQHFLKAASLLLRAEAFADEFNRAPSEEQLSMLTDDVAMCDFFLNLPPKKLILLPSPNDGSSGLVAYISQELAGYGSWKTERAFLENLKRFFVYQANQRNEQNAERIASLDLKHEELARIRSEERSEKAGMQITLSVEDVRMGMGMPVDATWEDAGERYEDFLRKSAVRAENNASSGQEFPREGRILRYEFPKESIDAFCFWVKHAKKKEKLSFKSLDVQRPKEEILDPIKKKILENSQE